MARAFDQAEARHLAHSWIGKSATRSRFDDLLDDATASLVFTVAHGALYPADSPHQRRLQGALICSDWSGRGPVQMAHVVEADNVSGTRRLDGRIFFLFGCFTGGTPRLDGFEPDAERRRTLAHQPFVASLPQALLDQGALAVIAHIDQAFPDAFLWERYGQLGVFQQTLERLLGGARVGYAMECFSDRYAHLATELIESLADPGDGDVENLGYQLWTAYQDARGLITLGDPAVRLGSVDCAERSG